MVGFIRESSNPEKESGANQLKLNTSNCPESFRFDFEDYSSEFGVGFSLASLEPFLDFDSFKDWVEEMEAPDGNKAEVGSGFSVENKLVDSVGAMDELEKPVVVKVECCDSEEQMGSRDVVGGDNGLLKLDGIQDCCMDEEMRKDLGSSKRAEVNSDDFYGETKTSGGEEADIGVVGDESCCKIESLHCSIEEGLEKVTLIGNEEGVVVTGSGMGHVDTGLEKVTLVGDEEGIVVAGSGMEKVDTPVVKEDSDSDLESECDASSSSSSSSSPSSSASSSSSGSDDDVEEEDVKEKENLCKIKRDNAKEIIDVEEGQIIDSDVENMVSWAEKSENEDKVDDGDSEGNSEEFQFDDDAMADDDEDTVKGPIKSANELKDLPPVPPVSVTLQPCHQISLVGVVLSVLGAQVIVEGSEKHNPLSEGSILWIVDGRLPLGIVDEIFGPVKTPYYIVRYNSESEVPCGIQIGTLVGFVLEFVGHVLNDKTLYQKGYDASGENDEEVLDEFDFSDDEKEAEYKRMIKLSKRGNNNQGLGPGNKRKNNRNRGKTWTKDHLSASHSPTVQSSQPTVQTSQPRQMQQHMRPFVSSSSEGNQLSLSPTGSVFSSRPNVQSSSQGYQLGPSPLGAFFPRGPTLLPQQLQQAGFLLNGLLANGIPFQQQNMGFPTGFQINNMPWLQQQLPQNLQAASVSPIPWQQSQQQQHISQMPITNPALCQQPFDLCQLVSGNSGAPLGPMNFAAGPANAPWAGTFGQNVSNQAPLNVDLVGQNLFNQSPLSQGLQGPRSQLPALQGQSCNSQPMTNSGVNGGTSPQFSQGRFSGGGGRGRGRKPFHRQGGHFGGRGNRQQPNK